MFTSDEDILKDITVTNNLKPRTVKGYKFAIQKYTEYHNTTLSNLLNEADQEEIL